LEATDTDTSARLFRNHVLGGSTIPEHWFGGGGDVNRATGEDMSNPTFKIMSLRQAFIGYMLLEMGHYCVRQWELAHTGKEPDLFDPIYKLSVSWPEMVAKDTTKYAAALQQVTQAVSLAITDKLMSVKTGIEVIESIAGRLGVSFDAEAELAAIAEQGQGEKQTVQPTGQKITEAVSSNLPGFKNMEGLKQSDIPEQMTTLLSQATQPMVDSMLETVIAMLDSTLSDGGDLNEAMNNLAVLYPELDSSELETVLGQAMQTSYLTGFNSNVKYSESGFSG
jgi:hypothetical protein